MNICLLLTLILGPTTLQTEGQLQDDARRPSSLPSPTADCRILLELGIGSWGRHVSRQPEVGWCRSQVINWALPG